MRLTWNTVDPSITLVVSRTPAHCIVIVHVAQCVSSARIRGDARIHAERVNTMLVTVAFAVGVTFWTGGWQWYHGN